MTCHTNLAGHLLTLGTSLKRNPVEHFTQHFHRCLATYRQMWIVLTEAPDGMWEYPMCIVANAASEASVCTVFSQSDCTTHPMLCLIRRFQDQLDTKPPVST